MRSVLSMHCTVHRLWRAQFKDDLHCEKKIHGYGCREVRLNRFIYWWQELALYMKCVIASMFHWINGVSRGKMKFREEKWIWLIFPHETPFFLCETSFFRTKIHLSNEARNFDSLSLTETAFTKLKLYTVAQFIYQCLARPGSLTCWTSRVLIRYPVDSR